MGPSEAHSDCLSPAQCPSWQHPWDRLLEEARPPHEDQSPSPGGSWPLVLVLSSGEGPGELIYISLQGYLQTWSGPPVLLRGASGLLCHCFGVSLLWGSRVPHREGPQALVHGQPLDHHCPVHGLEAVALAELSLSFPLYSKNFLVMELSRTILSCWLRE